MHDVIHVYMIFAELPQQLCFGSGLISLSMQLSTTQIEAEIHLYRYREYICDVYHIHHTISPLQ